ncbi:MAG: PIG-L deacetylase family protein [Phycisphaeraceae bacterium]
MTFQYARKSTHKVHRYDTLEGITGSADVSKETWLFACPHDDDIAIGSGLWMKAACEAGVEVHLLAATDGRMGYCSPEEKQTIAQTRAAELVESCKALSLTDESRIHLLGFPDCNLGQYLGRRPATEGDPQVAGFTGLQNAFVHKLREIRPTRLFMPSPMDYHPDHQVVYNEMQICIFHANGDIWPELGPPTQVPEVYEMAIYCDFPEPPNLQLKCSDEQFAAKLDAIAAYKSQKQIELLVQKVRDAGPFEYLREVNFKFYSASAYHHLFED